MGLLLGYDIGSSSIKASILDFSSGAHLASATSPSTELEILARSPGMAEQDPETWWEHVKKATSILGKSKGIILDNVQAIGISYQMHGLVTVDSNHEPLRPAVIWCDSRAVGIGEKAERQLGTQTCLTRYLNSPGNFTASKLAWIKQNEPDIYSRIHKAMLPGDYVAMKLTGEIKTTESGLSEMILWDFSENRLAHEVLDCLELTVDHIPEIVPTFSIQGRISKTAAGILGIPENTPVSYRAGDQPNNALALNVLEPGEIAATAGTSGVVYAVTEKKAYDPKSRVNTFIHVNNTPDQSRLGVLLCVNGTGILNSWVKNDLMGSDSSISYERMNELASRAPVGSDGLIVLPYGNGAERSLENNDPGASVHGINFNLHDRSHFFRAVQEGIVFALNYGVGIIRDMGIEVRKVRAGHANMFLSPIFCEAFANTVDASVELYDTDGSQGAARGAGIGAGIFGSFEDAFRGLQKIKTIEPESDLMVQYRSSYERWLDVLKERIG